ncbi:PREDICTED: transcription factor DIVARICATA-like [Camelina sativa]|uniref:Transcription factor DIVARICATA-like n=1 Tax=Camelina sativa TaxID=90675 RepID=A0ABM0YSZ3_CAMSA|nr:PREDICTED: transcription factor DIVARICATA-like [Camelina sativa]
MNRGIEVMSPATYLETSNWLFQENRGTKWTAEENKKFENALAFYDKDTPDRWVKVADMLPGKTVGDVIKQYRELEEDVSDIEAGLIPIPGYASDSFTLDWGGYDGAAAAGNNGFNMNGYYFSATAGGKRGSAARTAEHERKKGVPWTEEEHRQFLMGLKKYGKGDWRNIARNFVTTRTPTQVASHAQKYFIRQVNGGKDKRRSSIHDITTVNIPDSPDAAATDNVTANAPCSPPSVGGSQQEASEWDGQPLYDETAAAFYNQNGFQETLLGMSSTPYMAKLQEQSFLNASQFGSYNAYLQM